MGDLERRILQGIIEAQENALESCHAAGAWAGGLVAFLIFFNISCIFIIAYLINKDYIRTLLNKIINKLKQFYNYLKAKINNG